MRSHASPDLWICAEKNPRSAEPRRTFCDAEFRRKKTSRHPRENHQQNPTTQNQKKKPEDEFRRTIRLKKTKVRNFVCNRFGVTGSQFSAGKKSADLMPHNRPQQKNGPQSLQRFVWQTNLRLQCKVLSPRHYPTYWPWVAHVIGRNLPR